MLVIFAADLLTGADIRLHTLYVFPLAMVGLHCEKRRWLFGSIAVTIALQAATFLHERLALAPFLTDLGVATAAAVLTVFLAHNARVKYFSATQEARTDGLTNVANRRAMEEAIADELARCRRYGGGFALALVDIDHFKLLNDSRGHGTGDSALRALADALRSRARATDIVGRLGGDEFAVLMRGDMSEEEAISTCESMRAAVVARMAAVGLQSTVSIGCKRFVPTDVGTVEVLRIADTLLYEAKRLGRDRVVAA
ncbi:MAG: GGDEF domain-containing protein [Rhizobacter sp.]|nr:GGDEF domain-containing protein [Rhizobacter sp.]